MFTVIESSLNNIVFVLLFLMNVCQMKGNVIFFFLPRLQELIKLRNLEQKHKPMKSLLLDIDFRLGF